MDQLVPYLVRYYYLKDGVVTKKAGYYVYDTNVVNAVKHFQKDAGLTQDGKLTSSVLSTLKSLENYLPPLKLQVSMWMNL